MSVALADRPAWRCEPPLPRVSASPAFDGFALSSAWVEARRGKGHSPAGNVLAICCCNTIWPYFSRTRPGPAGAEMRLMFARSSPVCLLRPPCTSDERTG
jgi:hypothetical protein